MSSKSYVPKKITKRRNTRRNSCKRTENHFTVINAPTPAVVVKPSLSVAKRQKEVEVIDLKWCKKQTHNFWERFKQDYKLFIVLQKHLLHEEEKKERRNMQELDELKRTFNRMQVEETEMKRKRWCRYCELEATYLSSTSKQFYCSEECEKKQNNFFQAVQESFN